MIYALYFIQINFIYTSQNNVKFKIVISANSKLNFGHQTGRAYEIGGISNSGQRKCHISYNWLRILKTTGNNLIAFILIVILFENRR